MLTPLQLTQDPSLQPHREFLTIGKFLPTATQFFLSLSQTPAPPDDRASPLGGTLVPSFLSRFAAGTALHPRVQGCLPTAGAVLPDLSWTMEKRMRLEACTFWMSGPPGPGSFCPGQGRQEGQVQGGSPRGPQVLPMPNPPLCSELGPSTGLMGSVVLKLAYVWPAGRCLSPGCQLPTKFALWACRYLETCVSLFLNFHSLISICVIKVRG